ncbi:hypothetical protein SAMN04488116_1608 [Flagellimonas flava]|uniref:Uncharacterized protein n=1 Tax=Flagellimonas flava TaxID=570519 RepID=A0A1M5KIM3_9FLAO|nr:hypothetical protein SAMN04488116_1608 [Allomuricauda flava]
MHSNFLLKNGIYIYHFNKKTAKKRRDFKELWISPGHSTVTDLARFRG